MHADTNGRLPPSKPGIIEAVKLLLIVLAAAVFWQGAVAVNAALQDRALVTATPFLQGGLRLLVGIGESAPFGERLDAFWNINHRVVALIVLLAAVIVLLVRYLIIGRILDFLFLESPVRHRRGLAAFLVNILMIMLHAGAIYALTAFAAGSRAALTPVAFLALSATNALWLGGVLFFAAGCERFALRGIRFLLLSNVVAGALVFLLTWLTERGPFTAANPLLASELILITACIALAMCLAEGYVQSRIYCGKRRPAPQEPSGASGDADRAS